MGDRYDWPTIIEEVCDWVATGRSVLDYCRQDGKPSDVAVYARLARDEDATSRIARARSMGGDRIAEAALEIADASQDDPASVPAAKLRFEARMRLLSKWNSGRYGDRQQVEHSGGVNLSVVTGVPDQPKS